MNGTVRTPSLKERKSELLKEKKVDPQIDDAIRRTRLSHQHWYGLYVQPFHEKKIRDRINQKGNALLEGKVLNYQIKAWTPIRLVKKKWSDRVVESEQILTPGIIFVCLKQVDKLQIYVDKHIKGFIYDRVNRQAAPISEEIMNAFIEKYSSDETFEISVEKPQVGKRVKIIQGALAGFIGDLIECKGKNRFLIRFADITFSFEVNESDVVVADKNMKPDLIDSYTGVTSCCPSNKSKSVKMMTMEQFEEESYKKRKVPKPR